MCGGRGTRLGGETEKPLVPVRGVPMVQRVLSALDGSRAETVYAAVSPATPETARFLESVESRTVSVVETAGTGYVSDLSTALGVVDGPAVTVAADLPLLAADHVDDAIDAARSAGADDASTAPSSVTVCVPADLKRRLGVSVDTAFDHDGRSVAPTGLNVVAGETDIVQLTCDDRLAVNVNRPRDLELAEARCD
ncbi:NTP transferase domain-containing protein [Halogeometricum limi]|uniref:Adenosylcobinamide-phosphate guanylyltransferase n=1 Tax=Halogeometricum limi TaxID=555875 RepID=A0A1I6G230_9EURY|nr:NTP transferase domain-containing protein [Halogeometricum limi]SFR36236.1 adenosylcobinamide-phosphate guanylyltransferase [Halogeometricum limi]